MRRIAGAHGHNLSTHQLLGLFTESDVDGSRAIDLNEWCVARDKLMGLLHKMDEQQRLQADEARTAAREKQQAAARLRASLFPDA